MPLEHRPSNTELGYSISEITQFLLPFKRRSPPALPLIISRTSSGVEGMNGNRSSGTYCGEGCSGPGSGGFGSALGPSESYRSSGGKFRSSGGHQ
ncbi:hypothetical protein SUGI_0829520 [Cryptomeria japonica]|nr:hypothetical protein SUGI_0829520 [Cryptomeria japonica]